MDTKVTGIMGAMPEEIEELIPLLQDYRHEFIGMRSYHVGHINGIKTIVVCSRWGKVAAAVTTTTLIQYFGVTELIFTGLAAAIDHQLRVGDIVIGTRLIQHDMDARPFISRFEIPLLNRTWFEADQQLLEKAFGAIDKELRTNKLNALIGEKELKQFNIENPKLWKGAIASGDQFFSTDVQRNTLANLLPDVICVEMEGAAVAQVCYEYGIPFLIIRTISDMAGDASAIDFTAFVKLIASKYCGLTVRSFLEEGQEKPAGR